MCVCVCKCSPSVSILSSAPVAVFAASGPGRVAQMAGIAFSELLFVLCFSADRTEKDMSHAGTWAGSCGCFSLSCVC